MIRSNRGDVHLLGFSLLANFPDKDLRRFGDPFERARRCLDETGFEQCGSPESAHCCRRWTRSLQATTVRSARTVAYGKERVHQA
jgi:hypothetical protein